MKKILFTLISLFMAGLCFGESIERAVKISSKNNDKNALRVYEVSRETEIIGNYSATTIEYMIENSTNRVLEGEFEFPLEDGESVDGYALDINGKMRQGVAIEKEKGRQVFEDVVRSNVDPGLVEMTEGNNFKTRVYPISANGVRHLQITIGKELKAEDSQKKVYTQTDGRDTYFYFYQNVNNLDAEKIVPDTKRITVLYDVSDSAKNRNIDKEIKFIKAYAEKLDNPKIKFVAFANEIVSTFEIDFNKNAKNLSEKILSLSFDGATNLNVLNTISDAKEILLFSDGLNNWGDEKNIFANAKTNCRINTLNTSSSANYGMLKKIANKNNGIFINLKDEEVTDAVNKIFDNPLRVISVDYNEKDFEEIYPSVGTIIDEGISVAGILKRKSGKIKINLGHNGVVEQSIEKEISSVNSSHFIESEKVSRLWAMKKIADLEIDYDNNRTEIIELAKKYTVVTKDTSLIVLDNVSDYVKYGIVPPDELKDEYDKLVSRQNGLALKNSNSGIPKDVYTKFNDFKNWWNKTSRDFYKDSETPQFSTRSQRNTASSRASEASADVEWETEEVTMSADRVRMESNPMAMGQSNGTSAFDDDGKSVKLQSWNSNSGYIAVLKKTSSDKMYEKYLDLKKTYSASPAFFMEISDYFIEEGLKTDGIRILSNLAEMNLENTDVLRALGNKLMEQKEYEFAAIVFEKLTKLRAEVPQFYRDLGLCYAQLGEMQKAVDSLWYVASKGWDSRYSEIQQTCLNDMNSIIANNIKKIDTSNIDKKLMENFDVDLRVVLTWNTDDCDIDLWVTDPNGEKCYYGHKQTISGGRMSRDFTQGYGPEEFCVREALKGQYKIECNYYGNHQQKLLQPVIVQAEVYTNFGRPNQKKQILTLQLDDVKQVFFIGDVNIK